MSLRTVMHSMKLLKEPFEKILSGEKTVEVRLYDQKRQELAIGDTIEFSQLPSLNKKILVQIIDIIRFDSFKELFLHFGPEVLGRQSCLLEDFLNGVYKIYSKEQENCGVIGIKLKLIRDL